MSYNRKVLQKNAYRITKSRDKTCLRIRVPGGHLETAYFDIIKRIADDYGNGSVHMTTRQGFEIPDIPLEKMDEINEQLIPLLEMINPNFEVTKAGYPAAGTRNVSACIGNRVCPFANDDTTALAAVIESAVYPHDFHFKIAVTGCPNDCIKAHMQDFGIICTTEPRYNANKCISCGACVDNCQKRVTGALSMQDFDIVRDTDLCIGCGECILKCPTGAWTRSDKKYYRMVIMGRTGKKNPRLAMPFVKWATFDVVLAIIKNTYRFVDEFIDRTLPKEHIGYIVDRTGYSVFREAALKDVELNSEIEIAQDINWSGYWYKNTGTFKG
jgi:anaerobic sulfite reductase subunit C